VPKRTPSVCGGVKKREKERKRAKKSEKKEQTKERKSQNFSFVFFSSDIRVFLFFLVSLSLLSL
tara:strand:- start:399 stop:590 length:192 start_codon:yes stop_codon:yes gene_type:complete